MELLSQQPLRAAKKSASIPLVLDSLKIFKMNLRSILVLSFGSALLAGCSVDGCTDANATNFDPAADNFDGSCQYEGEVVFWYGEATSNALISIYSNSLSFYVDGQIEGSTATSQYWTGAPECGQNGSITITKALGASTALASTYEVIDDYGDLWWSGIINFEANTCSSIELVP